MRKIFKEFKIDIDKISVMLTDAGAAIKKAVINIVGKKRHLACLGHAISHVLPESVKESVKLNELITKIGTIVTLIKRSNNATAKLKQSQVDDDDNKNVKTIEDALKLINDCVTRWTSTIDMIDRYLILEPYIFVAMSACNHPIDILSRDEVKILADVFKIMKPFRDVINEISGDVYPTCSIIIPLVQVLENIISNCHLDTEVGKSFKDTVQKHMKKRFEGLEKNLILACSTVLDPRFRKKENFTNPMARVDAIVEIDNQLKQMKRERNKIKEQARKTQEIQANSHQSINQNLECISIWDAYDKLNEQQVDEILQVNQSGWELEIHAYLQSSNIPRKDNIFDFWKNQKRDHPELSKIALQRLSNLATTLLSERLFSQAGLINRSHRSKLSGVYCKTKVTSVI
ncbi:E3 SUMO-protein ligase ZBED1-like isoform X2 [Phymastichus coffea]|uniref:E3 SUMO-protein ligase ZBED1-like isoform X2 n=1 Tax=Phymastichus coffea TaxID=108790 RepID=UPI00273C25F8|nr:E3 SUMO-protein ligase ZBED1-like isoform X2 [Phymastichus coffea]